MKNQLKCLGGEVYYILVLITLICLLHASCSGRYWFRKKVNVEKDTTEVEKEFRVIW